jgi:hypothetical protein
VHKIEGLPVELEKIAFLTFLFLVPMHSSRVKFGRTEAARGHGEKAGHWLVLMGRLEIHLAVRIEVILITQNFNFSAINF